MQDNEFNPETNANPEENQNFTVSEDTSNGSPGGNESFNEPELSSSDFVTNESSAPEEAPEQAPAAEEKPAEEPKPEEAPVEESAPTTDADLSNVEHPAEESSSDDVDLTTDSAAETAAATTVAADAPQQKTAFIPIIIGIFSVLSIGSIVALIIYVIMPIGSGPSRDDYAEAYDKALALQTSCTPAEVGAVTDRGFITTLKDQYTRCLNDYTALKEFVAVKEDEEASALLDTVLSNLQLIGKFVDDVSGLAPVEQAFLAVAPEKLNQTTDWDEYLDAFYDAVEALSDDESLTDIYDILAPLMEEYYDTALDYLDSFPVQAPEPLNDEDATEGDDTTADDTEDTDCVDPEDIDCVEPVVPGAGDPAILATLKEIAADIQAALDEFVLGKFEAREINLEQITEDAKKLTEHLRLRS